MIKSVIGLILISASSWASNFEEFKDITEKSYLYRMQVNESYVYLKKVMSEDYLLTAKDIKLISEEGKKHLDIAKRANNFMSSIKFESTLDVAMFLGVYFTLSDSYYYAYDQFSRNYKIRRILEEENSSFDQKKYAFSNSFKALFSLKYRNKVLKALRIFDRKTLKGEYFEKLKKVSKLVKESYSYKNRKELGLVSGVSFFKKFLERRFRAVKSKALFNLRQRTLKLLYGGSKIFGNAAGVIQTRKGKLYNNDNFIKEVKSELRPLDTLIEKTPFRLTDKFIPGYWGHAAIYIGNKDQLVELGLWNHPNIRKYHKEILKGQTIVEALRSGVEINSVKHFTDIDDFSILRLKTELTLKEKKDYILRVISHIGKEYDFAFNVETPSKIVCSELHYLTYLDVKFKIETILGQPTISVDSVAFQGMKGMSFAPISLYLDGRKILNETQFNYDSLLEESINKNFLSFLPDEKRFSYYLD